MEEKKQYVIRMKNVSKSYESNLALNQVNLNVPEGAIYGILGPAGAGKTTILKLLLSLALPDQGVILVQDREVKSARKQVLRNMGGSIQPLSFYEHLSAYDNLSIVSLMKNTKRDEIKEVLERLKLLGCEHMALHQLPICLKQRLAIAMALIGKPKLVLLDEPFNHLDPQGIEDVGALLHELTSREHRTVLITSQRQEEIERVCNYAGILKQGRMLYEGSVWGMKENKRITVRVGVINYQTAITYLNVNQIEHSVKDGSIYVTASREKIIEITRALVHLECGVHQLVPEVYSVENIVFN